jgi:hypothetical protein
MNPKLSRLGVVLVLAALVGGAWWAPGASAYCEAPAYHIFVRTGNTFLRQGDRAKILIRNNDLEIFDCSGLAFTTTHLEDCAYICGTQVETGFRQSTEWGLLVRGEGISR